MKPPFGRALQVIDQLLTNFTKPNLVDQKYLLQTSIMQNTYFTFFTTKPLAPVSSYEISFSKHNVLSFHALKLFLLSASVAFLKT